MTKALVALGVILAAVIVLGYVHWRMNRAIDKLPLLATPPLLPGMELPGKPGDDFKAYILANGEVGVCPLGYTPNHPGFDLNYNWFPPESSVSNFCIGQLKETPFQPIKGVEYDWKVFSPSEGEKMPVQLGEGHAKPLRMVWGGGTHVAQPVTLSVEV